MKPTKPIAFSLLSLAATVPTWAAVSLEITKPPVAGPPTGPVQDPIAAQGQWFLDPTAAPGQQATVRPYEFHDNPIGAGGGNMSTRAIEGIVSSLTLDPSNNITAFTVSASITNDTTTWEGMWPNGTNSHNEQQYASLPYVGTLYDTLLTIEFALADINLQPQWIAPYRQIQPEIVATNEDMTAWYCYDAVYDPGNPGNYYVPAWDFGDIAPNQTVTKSLTFTVNGAISPADPRYNPLLQSFNDQSSDILLNRTTSLKISTWVDGIGIDNGMLYPPSPVEEEVLRFSNASVFHVPEPGTGSMIGLLGVLALLRRRRFNLRSPA